MSRGSGNQLANGLLFGTRSATKFSLTKEHQQRLVVDLLAKDEKTLAEWRSLCKAYPELMMPVANDAAVLLLEETPVEHLEQDRIHQTAAGFVADHLVEDFALDLKLSLLVSRSLNKGIAEAFSPELFIGLPAPQTVQELDRYRLIYKKVLEQGFASQTETAKQMAAAVIDQNSNPNSYPETDVQSKFKHGTKNMLSDTGSQIIWNEPLTAKEHAALVRAGTDSYEQVLAIKPTEMSFKKWGSAHMRAELRMRKQFLRLHADRIAEQTKDNPAKAWSFVFSPRELEFLKPSAALNPLQIKEGLSLYDMLAREPKTRTREMKAYFTALSGS